MSINVLRTDTGWWVEKHGGLTAVDTTAVTTAQLLADLTAVRAAADHPDPPGRAVTDEEVRSPVTAPCRVVAQMVNYRSHAVDSGFQPDAVLPTFFRKASASITSPYGPIVRPPHVQLLDYEIELGLVIGRRLEAGSRVEPESAVSDYVAGVVVANDVSARDIQLTRGQFYESKSYPSFTPVGPYLTLLDADELPLLDRLRLRLTVNGEERQRQTTADMITRPGQALSLLARFQTLDPGDLVLTGTPGGTALKAPARAVEILGSLLPPAVKWSSFFRKQAANPRYLKEGDAVQARIEYLDGGIDLGTQRNVVHDEEDGV